MNLVSVLEGDDRSWQEYANCMGVDPDLFFPERGASTREAKEVCKGCVVREDCLEFALANGEKFGIWGGMTEVQRKKTRPRRVPLPAPHERILLDELDAKIMVSAYLLSRGVMNGTGFDKDTIAREYGLSGKTVERRRRKALEQLTSMSKAEHSQLLRTLGADKFGLTA